MVEKVDETGAEVTEVAALGDETATEDVKYDEDDEVNTKAE